MAVTLLLFLQTLLAKILMPETTTSRCSLFSFKSVYMYVVFPFTTCHVNYTLPLISALLMETKLVIKIYIAT